ncbi:MAG: alpha/beta fold hydrolase [Candidatus Eisenbacteria bacterium]|nr:alpha/beta fold hydrolase [Candidatus Eisenbacteria bacterium]
MRNDEETTGGRARPDPSRRRSPPPLHIVTLLVSALILFLAGSAWLALYPGVPADLGGVPNLDSRATRVSIPVGGADHLDGFLILGSRRALVVIFHGYGRDHTRAWRYGRFLSKAGFSVLAADFRSSRAADRKPTTLGFYEVEDARAVLDWTRSDARTRALPLALLGESLGGSVALAVAAEHPEVRAVIADCPFVSGARALDDALERWAHVPRWPAASITAAMAERLTGHDPRALDVLAAARRLDRTPVLFIASERDDRLSAGETRDLWRAAGAKDPIWILADCGHNQAWLRHRAEYERRVLAFLESRR